MGERWGLFEELKRRSVIRVAGLYLVAAWLLLQVGETTFEALGLPDGSQRFLIFLLAFGFPVALVVSWIFDLTPDGIVRTSKPSEIEVARLRVGRRVDYVIIGGLLIALGVTSWQLSRSMEGDIVLPSAIPETGAQPPPTQQAARAAELSIVVLPFENMSADPDQDYFADGLTEDLTTDLTNVAVGRGLLVISRTTAFTYKDRNATVDEIARQLGVRYVLEGSVRKAQGRLRITAQLIDAETGFHIWSERYDRDISDLFAVQEEVVQEIVDALQLEISLEAVKLLRRKTTDDLSAYDAYMRGMAHFVRFTRADHAEARPFFARAVELDPQFAESWVYLGQLEIFERVFGWNLSPERTQRASDYAQRAISLDPRNRGANVLVALLALSRNAPDAVDIIERTAKLAPQHPGALILLASVRYGQGKISDAEELMQRVARLNPDGPVTLTAFAFQAAQAGRVDEAAALWERSLTMGPDNVSVLISLADYYQTAGRNEDARRMVKEILRVKPDHTAGSVAELLGMFRGLRAPAASDRVVENLRAAGLPD